jgi:hypothetical protein
MILNQTDVSAYAEIVLNQVSRRNLDIDRSSEQAYRIRNI